MPATSTQRIDEVSEKSAMSATMQAIVQEKYGTSDTLRLAEIDRPTIEAGEVLVQIRAASLDRGTWHLMTGMPFGVRLVSGLRAPKRTVPGLALAGVVAAVARDVTRFVPGDEVLGIGVGSLAEFAAAREDKLALKPAVISFEQAAGLPVSAPTALRGLSDVGRLEARQHVLIIGASGGVGASPCSLPGRSAQRSPLSAALRRSISSDRSAQITPSTTPGTISRRVSSGTT